MYQILTGEKNLNHPVIGSRRLNKAGLHGFRVRLANWCNQRRRSIGVGWLPSAQCAELDANGVLAIPDFLPVRQFERLRDEVERAVEKAAQENPPAVCAGRGFGQKQLQSWGFDRFDGGTLNRFLTIDDAVGQGAAAFCNDSRLRDLSASIAGGLQLPRHVWIYQMVHGESGRDPQKEFHRDTFFSSVKFWFSVRPVGRHQGPFEYIKGSHKLTADRLAWEKQKAREAMMLPRGKRSASFRLSPGDLDRLADRSATRFDVAENTLIIADTFGFHRRGDADPGAQRLALYGNMRPWPFGLWRHHH